MPGWSQHAQQWRLCYTLCQALRQLCRHVAEVNGIEVVGVVGVVGEVMDDGLLRFHTDLVIMYVFTLLKQLQQEELLQRRDPRTWLWGVVH